MHDSPFPVRTDAPVIDRRHLVRMFEFVGIYALAALTISALMLGPVHPDGWWRWIVAAPFYVLAAASLHGISLFTHEAVHGTLARDSRLNAGLGALCAWPVLQNFTAYRVLHLEHHDHLGVEGDPDHYPNYTRWSWMVFLMNWGRLLLGYPAYLVAIPILGFRHGTARDRVGIVAETVIALGGLLLAIWLVPWPALLHLWLVPMLLINTMVNIRGMSQHTFLEEHHGDTVWGTRSILTNRVTAFFMCNENYHLEHHLHPGVPWFQLPRLHAALREQLVAEGAPFIPSYAAFVREFVVGSLRRSPLGRKEAGQ